MRAKLLQKGRMVEKKDHIVLKCVSFFFCLSLFLMLCNICMLQQELLVIRIGEKMMMIASPDSDYPRLVLSPSHQHANYFGCCRQTLIWQIDAIVYHTFLLGTHTVFPFNSYAGWNYLTSSLATAAARVVVTSARMHKNIALKVSHRWAWMIS